MKKGSKAKGKAGASPKVDPYLEGFMGKLLDRFASLERKMDAVIASLPARSSGGADHRAEQNLQARERVARRERIMFEAICADCKTPCEVPFRPAEGRAIYCKECFSKRKSSGQDRPQGPSNAFANNQNFSSRPIAQLVAAMPARAAAATQPASAKKKPAAKKSKKK